MTDYKKQAMDFLKDCGATCKISFVGMAVNTEWKETETRPLYRVTLKTGKGEYSFNFWDSLHNKEIIEKPYSKFDLNENRKLSEMKNNARPSEYEIISCLTKYDVGTFEDFCADFGYDEDSRTAERIYFAVQQEYKNLCRIFTPEQMEAMAEIQ